MLLSWSAMQPVNDDEDKREQLQRLRQQHRELDAAIGELIDVRPYDHLHVQRLKKQKLALRDKISALEDQVLPDIIA